MTAQPRSVHPLLIIGLAAVTFVIAAICAAAAKKFGLIDSQTVKRVGLIGIGCVLIVAGNFVPKMQLFERQGYDPRRMLAAQRASGWILVLSGLSIVALWLFWATPQTMLASSLIGLGAFALVGAAWAWLALGPRQAPAASTEKTDGVFTPSLARHTLLYILFGLFWTFAIFLADYLWGDDVSMWMAVIFSIMLTCIAALTRPRRAKQET